MALRNTYKCRISVAEVSAGASRCFAGAALLLDQLSIPHFVDQLAHLVSTGLVATAELTEALRPLTEIQKKRLRVRFRAIAKSVTGVGMERSW